MVEVHKSFWSRIVSLSIMNMCQVCNQCYISKQVLRWHKAPICKRYRSEKGAYQFSFLNNRDVGEQIEVLRVLTQVKEMLKRE